MSKRQQLARQAVSAALRFRALGGARPWQPVCPVELALQAGIEVRFVDVPSLEGMYWKREHPAILIGAERPPGRQAFTCAHELGHHYFGHGTRIDEVLGGPEGRAYRDPQEYAADVFAAFLLMPKSAVEHAFAVRGVNARTATPQQLFRIAAGLGVGYGTLVCHLQLSLDLISGKRATELLRESPKKIRAAILPGAAATDLVPVDQHWDASRAIDLQVDDFVLLPPGTQVEGNLGTVSVGQGASVVLHAERAGIGSARLGDWKAFVRVSRRRFAGRAAFRHLEEPDD